MRVGDPTDLLVLQCKERGLPAPMLEFRFCEGRRWRADFGWPEQMLLGELEGGTWLPGGGRHNRGAGYEKDLLKYNAAAILGWRVIRFTPAMVQSGIAIAHIARALSDKEATG